VNGYGHGEENHMLKSLTELKDLIVSDLRVRVAVAFPYEDHVMHALCRAVDEIGIGIEVLLYGKADDMHPFSSLIVPRADHFTEINCSDEVSACESAVKAVRDGRADVLMKGSVSTATIMKAALNKQWGLVQDSLLSHAALVQTPYYHKLVVVTDGAINIAPTLDQKAMILENSVRFLHALGVAQPRVAVLAALEKVNEKMKATVEAAELKRMYIDGAFPLCSVDGPLALDNAVSLSAAEGKGIVSEVAGDADILLAPTLECGNILYKSLNFMGGARSAAIVLGAARPIILSSRADSEESRYYSILLAATVAGRS